MVAFQEGKGHPSKLIMFDLIKISKTLIVEVIDNFSEQNLPSDSMVTFALTIIN